MYINVHNMHMYINVVCLYPINEKMDELIFCCGNSHDPRENLWNVKNMPENFGNLINQSMLTEISGKFYNYEEKWLFEKQYLNC